MKKIDIIEKLKQSHKQQLNDLKHNLNGSFVVVDIETTGLDKKTCQITEIGAVKYNHGIDGEVEEFSVLCKIDGKIPTQLLQLGLNDITDELLESEGIPIHDALTQFNEFISGCDVMVTQNGYKFDLPFITYQLLKNKISVVPLVSISEQRDTMEISKFQNRNQSKHSLGLLCNYYGVSYDSDSHHRAVYDCRVTMDVYLSQIGAGEFPKMDKIPKYLYDQIIDSKMLSFELPINLHTSIAATLLDYIKGVQ